jgi:HPt (histidine-containing phosphotransfer) domain-containing protein
MTGSDPAFLVELLDAFVDGAAEQLADMEKAAADGSTERLVRPAHSLKGNSANVGAHRLEEMARALEHAAREGLVDDAPARIAAITAELETVKAELATYRGRP